MYRRLLALFSAAAFAWVSFMFFPSEGCASQGIAKDEAYYNETGLGYFNKGFYELMPRGKREEASQLFEQAIAAFKEAISLNENYVEAHRNLARVFYVQKRFSEAAESYKKVAELTPNDIDTYLKIASAYTKLNNHSEAIEQLEKAKGLAIDQTVIDKLDNYIKKIKKLIAR
ncbi:tetratricopeptide repeat protein [bacterium]|nr:tetratricopeptide repeat protein [bacterium]